MDGLVLGALFLGVSLGVPLAALVIAGVRAWRTGLFAAMPPALGAVTFVLLAPVGCGGTDEIPGTSYCWALSGVGASVHPSDAIARWVPLDPSFLAFGLLAAGAAVAMVAVAYTTHRVARVRRRHDRWLGG